MGPWKSDNKPPVRVVCVMSLSLTHDHDWSAHYRKEGILILSGGLIVHNLRNLQSFVKETADQPVIQFNDAVTSAISVTDVSVFPRTSAHTIPYSILLPEA